MDENKLVNMLKRKNKQGLVLLIENYSGLLYSVISKILVDFSQLHEEVLNDSLLAIWENIFSFDPARSSFKNWSASVARYKAIDALRKEVKHQCLKLDEDFENYSEDEFNKILIKEVFSYLSEDDRKLFKLLFLDGFSYDEVSKDLGQSKNALYSRVKRIRKNLRDEFNGG